MRPFWIWPYFIFGLTSRHSLHHPDYQFSLGLLLSSQAGQSFVTQGNCLAHFWISAFTRPHSLNAWGTAPPYHSRANALPLFQMHQVLSALACYSVLKFNLYVDLHGIQCPPSLGYKRMWQTAMNLLHPMLSVMCSAIPINLGQKSLPHKWGEKEAIKKKTPSQINISLT